MSGGAANPFDSSLSNEQLVAFIEDPETRETVSSAVASRWPSACSRPPRSLAAK